MTAGEAKEKKKGKDAALKTFKSEEMTEEVEKWTPISTKRVRKQMRRA